MAGADGVKDLLGGRQDFGADAVAGDEGDAVAGHRDGVAGHGVMAGHAPIAAIRPADRPSRSADLAYKAGLSVAHLPGYQRPKGGLP
ncbi:hypothetical protein GCM10012286_44150 [Streptomyces lasiicapitis]|uniref:Uncharacterized protein n=1 Tax=Streptomyces lasiicapitis TaxID=1923961 RepID=A0ABQ2M9F1_9ACTN|nr:hypothetical protein GCM10012286_44150 [Streptomyces lasiicapitis]